MIVVITAAMKELLVGGFGGDVRVRGKMLLQELSPSLLVLSSGHEPLPVPLLPSPHTRTPPPVQQLVGSTVHREGGAIGPHAAKVHCQPLGKLGDEGVAASEVDVLNGREAYTSTRAHVSRDIVLQVT